MWPYFRKLVQRFQALGITSLRIGRQYYFLILIQSQKPHLPRFQPSASRPSASAGEGGGGEAETEAE